MILLKRDYELIDQIVDKGMKLADEWEIQIGKRIDVRMTIEACHRANPMRLGEFANDEGQDFSHDFFGIIGNFDPSTKTLRNFFSPRFTA
jgi:hypothetical protein